MAFIKPSILNVQTDNIENKFQSFKMESNLYNQWSLYFVPSETDVKAHAGQAVSL